MSKIVFTKKRKETYVEIKLTSGQVLNNREYEILREGRYDYLLVPEAGKKSIKYNVNEYISLEEYFASVTSKDRFLSVIQYILTGISESVNLMFEIKQFVFDKKYIFVNRQDKSVRFVYVPIINEDNEYELKAFFRDLAFSTVFNQMEDCSYVSKYIQYFNQHIDFSLYDFHNFINGLRENTKNGAEFLSEKLAVSDGNSKKPDKIKCTGIYTPSFSAEDTTTVAHPSKLLSGRNNLLTNTCPKCGKTLRSTDSFCVMCGQRVRNQSEDICVKPKTGGTTMLGLDDNNGGTTILSEAEMRMCYPKIIRIKTGEEADIYKDNFVIGQAEGNADFCISDNSAISREHVHIIKDGNKYYLIDYKSTNGTYIQNRKIEKNKYAELTDGIVFRLANEEFRFKI